jgi:pullulanase/glycogen debranching enzyme
VGRARPHDRRYRLHRAVNAHYEAVEFKLPAQPEDARWALRLDTTNAKFEKEERVFAPGDSYALQGRALALFEAV